MKRVCAPALTLALVAAAAPVGAGVVYVPVIPLEGKHEIRVTTSNNHPATARHYTSHLLPLNSDGTLHPRSAPTGMFVQPLRSTRAVVPSLSQSGLLEISAPPQLGFSAEIVAAGSNNSPDNIGVSLPIITSDNVTAADGWLMVQGLQRSTNGTATDVGVVNLGHEATRCTAWLMGADGVALGASAVLDLRPLSMAYFGDVISLFGRSSAVDVLFRLSCDQDFYSFGVIRNGASGALKIRGPAARGTSLLFLPGEQPPAEPPPSNQPPPASGGVVFTRPGTFHTSTRANPTMTFDIPVGANREFRRIELSFNYRHGSWYPGRESFEHNLFWLQRGGTGANWIGWYGHVFGYANIHGPQQNRMRNIWSVDIWDRILVTWSSAAVQVGRTYKVEYVYDGVAGTWLYTLTDGATGQQVGQLPGQSPAPVKAPPNGFFFIYFGHKEHCSYCPEVPNYGSVWSDLRVEFIP